MKSVHVLIFGICECVRLHGREELWLYTKLNC